MSQMPDFDPGPAGLELPAPKKPRRKPTKRKKLPPIKTIIHATPKKRKRRAVKRIASNNHAGGRFTPEVYRLIGQLMEMPLASRDLVIGIVRGLTK